MESGNVLFRDNMQIMVEKDQTVQDEFLLTFGNERTKEKVNYETKRTS